MNKLGSIFLIVILLLLLFISLIGCNNTINKEVKNNNLTSNYTNDFIIKNQQNKSIFIQKLTSKEIILKPPINNSIYFGAFPDFGGEEDNVTRERIIIFKNLIEKNITWAYFSQNWYNGIKYPRKEINIIYKEGIIPFVRLMPRSNEAQFEKEKYFNLDNIINGKFDKELKQWAIDSKKDNIPLLIDFAVEMNGDWFSWSGFYNGGNIKDMYGKEDYFDGPEKYRDAYRHIIDIFKKENATHITWFFHINIYSIPEEEWNKPKYYYPGDDYIDWIGVSIYGPLHPKEDYWETFNSILKKNYKSILEISPNKPIALLEFGVTDNHPFGKKKDWLEDAFKTILNNTYINFSAISYWNENWEEEEKVKASLRVDSSEETLKAFRRLIKNNRFITNFEFTNISLNNKFLNDIKQPKKFNINKSKKNIGKKNEWYKPKPGISWQWQLDGKINLNYTVDLYDLDLESTPQRIIEELHKENIKVICYFNAGAYEPYRRDARLFPKEVIGNIMEGWEDERWLDISNYEKFSEIIIRRLNLAVEKSCDGIEPDNIHAYQENTGFNISYNDQLEYNRWLTIEAHKRNLSIAMKNDGEQVKDLIDYFDFAIVEECFQWNECHFYEDFIKNNKAVLEVEYELTPLEFCKKANKLNFSSLKMNLELKGKRVSCH